MKKRCFPFLMACLLTVSMAACGGGGMDYQNTSSGTSAPQASNGAGIMGMEDAPMEMDDGIAAESFNMDSAIYDSSKLILRGSISAEATDYEAAVAAIEQQVAAAGGYIESSNTSGSVGWRWANFTIRVPREQFENTFRAVGENCHIVESSRSQENVSASYYDAEARKTALETKRDRLLALLEKAETMEDIIALESALSDVQYEIESLSGTLRGYDRLIEFSTIEVYLNEVRDLSVVQAEDSFLSDLKTAAITGTRGLVSLVQNVVLTLVYGWWAFLLMFAGALFLLRAAKRRRKDVPPAPSASTPQDKEK